MSASKNAAETARRQSQRMREEEKHICNTLFKAERKKIFCGESREHNF